MPRSSEEAARDAMFSRLELITVSNGFATDSGLRVVDGWDHRSNYDKTPWEPYIVVTELETYPAQEGEFTARTSHGPYEWVVSFLVEGFIRAEATVDSEADEAQLRELSYAVRADIRRALVSSEPDLTEVNYIRVMGCNIDDREGGTRTLVVSYPAMVGATECDGVFRV